MADNYLEQRMNDMRAGRLRPGAHRQSRPLARRVFVVGGIEGDARDVARKFLAAGCRVAVTGTDRAVGERMAHDEGVRFIPVSSGEDIAQAFSGLLKAWRDVDIVIADTKENFATVEALWKQHKERYPIPTDFQPRLLLLSDQSAITLLLQEI